MPPSLETCGHRKCLIVEDSTFDQRMMMRAVQAMDRSMDVEVVSSISEARAALELGGVAIILLDNNLPDGKGANFALELADSPRLGRIPIIIVSDWPSPFMWQKAQLAGVRQVVNKADFNAAVLAASLPGAGTLH